MAKSIQITASVDETVKDEAVKILQELGLSMSAAIEIYLRQIVRRKGIPFELSLSSACAPKEPAFVYDIETISS